MEDGLLALYTSFCYVLLFKQLSLKLETFFKTVCENLMQYFETFNGRFV